MGHLKVSPFSAHRPQFTPRKFGLNLGTLNSVPGWAQFCRNFHDKLIAKGEFMTKRILPVILLAATFIFSSALRIQGKNNEEAIKGPIQTAHV